MLQARKGGDPIVALTAYTARMAQLLDPHCDLLLVGDSLGQVIYGLPSTIPVSLDMMCAHGARVGARLLACVVAVDMPFGSMRQPAQAFEAPARAQGNRRRCSEARRRRGDGGDDRLPHRRGIPVIGHVGLTPQAVNVLGGYGSRGTSDAEAAKILRDAKAVADAGAFAIVVEGVVEELGREVTRAVSCPTIGIGASAECDGQILVTEDMLGLFERTPRFVKLFDDIAGRISAAAQLYAKEVHARSFPGEDQIRRRK
jgi:3-methyl-2-oxobutanoate hydroxymethyltransferase